MASVYIPYSNSLNRFYTGSCLSLEIRLKEHLNKSFINSYTAKADDWILFFRLDDLKYDQARKGSVGIPGGSYSSRIHFVVIPLKPGICAKLNSTRFPDTGLNFTIKNINHF